jgi:hypothetical protein
MRSLHSRKRALSLGLVAAFAIGMPLAVPEGVKASNNVGSGVVHGTTVFDGDGLATDPETCVPNLGFSVKGIAPGVVYNTVTTGFVGDLEIEGRGTSECGATLGSGGTLTLKITGTGPTGSEIICDPLTGGFSRTATVVSVELTGSCSVNDYGTAPIRFLSVLNFTPTAPMDPTTDPPTIAGVNGTKIKEALFDGKFVIIPL